MPEVSKKLSQLVRRMDGGDARDCVIARQELANMGPLAVTHLIAELQRAPRVQKKFSMLLIGMRILLLPALLAGLAISAVIVFVAATDGDIGYAGDMGCMGDLFSGWNMREQYHENLHKRRWNQIVRALSQLDDWRVAGPLAVSLEYADATTQPAIYGALHRLLPHFSADEARALTPEQRQALYTLLERNKGLTGGRETALCLTLLRAFDLAEDAGAIPVVSGVVTSAGSGEVHAAALQTLNHLRSIAARNQVSQSLLRGASAPATPADMLLRPAQASLPVNPAYLLRADTAEADSFHEKLSP